MNSWYSSGEPELQFGHIYIMKLEHAGESVEPIVEQTCERLGAHYKILNHDTFRWLIANEILDPTHHPTTADWMKDKNHIGYLLLSDENHRDQVLILTEAPKTASA